MNPPLPLNPSPVPLPSDAGQVNALEGRRPRKPRAARLTVSDKSPAAATTTATGPVYEIRVSYRRLFASAFNYRLIREPDYIAELAENIRANGLIQNLSARPAADDLFEVFAGGSRFQAVALLVEQGRWDPDEANIPIQVREGISDADLLLLSLSENHRRRDTHWLEDARGIGLAVEALAGSSGPQKGDGVTAALAERLQTTQRWIQILYQLHQELHPDLKAFFLAHRDVSIEVAKAVRAVPADHQPAALDQLRASVANGWKINPDALKQFLLSKIPRAENAIFDRSLYDGPVTTLEMEPDFEVEYDFCDEDEEDSPGDPEADPTAPRTTELLLDSDTFSRLQEEAIAAKREELALQYPFVEIVRTDNPWGAINQAYRRIPGHDGAGAVIVVTPDLRVTVETDLVPVAAITDSGKPVPPAEPLTKAQLGNAHRWKTAAMQRRIVDSPTDATRLALLAFLGYSGVCKVELAPISPDDRAIDPSLIPSLRLLQKHFGDLFLLPKLPEDPESSAAPIVPDSMPTFSFRFHDRGDAAERVVKILAALSASEVQQLFCAVVALRTGTFCDYAPAVGDRPAATAFAQTIGADVEGAFLNGGLTDQYLKGYRKPHLIRIAKACGVEAENFDGLTQADLRGLILRSPGRSTFIPPELRFGPDSVLAAEIERVGQMPSRGKKAKKATKKGG